MKKKLMIIASFMTFLFLLSINTPLVQAATTVSGYDYAPYFFYDFYSYLSDGMEFDDYIVTRNYPANDEHIYQYNFDNSGTNTIYVYQLQDEGIYELAYFPHDDATLDFRYHSDSNNVYRSLVLPNSLTVGQIFYQGYYQDQAVLVVDILDSFTLLDTEYQNVVVLEKKIEDFTYTTYLAPNIGIIWKNKLSDDGQFNITTNLVEYGESPISTQANTLATDTSEMRILSYEEAVDYARAHPELVAQIEAVIKDGYGVFHDFTEEQIATLPDDAYFNTLVLQKTSIPTGGDPSTTVNFLTSLYPELLSDSSFSQVTEVETNHSSDLINREAVIEVMRVPNVFNERLSYNEAQEIVDQIMADILQNHHNYSSDNRAAFSKAISAYLPSFLSTAQTIMIPDYFYPYIDSLNVAVGSTAEGPTIDSNIDYSVDMAELYGTHLFESQYPAFKQIEIDFSNGKLSYQGNVTSDTGLYDVRIENNATRNINVAHFNEASSRNVTVTTNLIIQGETPHYHFDTNSAYFFYNSAGGISIALPDFNNELTHANQATWIEYQLVR